MKKNNIFFIIFFLFQLISYFLLVKNNLLRLDRILYSSPDSISYRATSDWILGLSKDSSSFVYRPFFYPLLLGLRHLFTNYSIWILQIIMLISSSIFVYKAIVNKYSNRLFGFIGYMLMTTNITLLFLTTHALTEITSTFLVSVWVYIFSMSRWDRMQNKDYFLVLLLSTLTVTKPVFSIMLYVSIFLLCIKSIILKRVNYKSLVILLFCLLPVIVQSTMMKNTFNTWEISRIGSYTVRAYLISRAYALENNLGDNLIVANKIVGKMNDKQLYGYIGAHFPTIVKIYIRSTFMWNILERTNFSKSKTILDISQFINYLYFFIHLIMGLFSCIYLFTKKINLRDKAQYVILYIFFLTIVLSAGISFWQGDRLVVISLPIWIVAYSLILIKWRYIFPALSK